MSNPSYNYRLVYDIGDAWPDWWIAAMGLVFLVVGALLFRGRHAPRGGWGPLWQQPWTRALFAVSMMAFSLLWTGLAAYGVFGSHWAGQRILRAGEATVLEGRVDVLVDRKTTRLEVNGVEFTYAFSNVTAGYRPAVERLHLGERVRIHYADVRGHRAILRLEVQE